MKRLSPLWTVLVLAVLLLSDSTTHAIHEQQATRSLRGLQGVSVAVKDLDSEAEEVGLTKSLIKSDVEQKLHLAGIKILTGEETDKTPGLPRLAVGVTVLTSKKTYIFCTDIELYQGVSLTRDPTNKVSAITWSDGTVGMSKSVEKIREAITDSIEEFIQNYRLANLGQDLNHAM